MASYKHLFTNHKYQKHFVLELKFSLKKIFGWESMAVSYIFTKLTTVFSETDKNLLRKSHLRLFQFILLSNVMNPPRPDMLCA